MSIGRIEILERRSRDHDKGKCLAAESFVDWRHSPL